MSSGLIAPEQETFPNRYRWSVEACYRLRELGFLEGKFEVIDGEVVNKMGQKPPHRIAVILLAEWLAGLFGARRVQTEGPIALTSPDGDYSEPEPDVAVTHQPTTAFVNHHPGPEDIGLVVEVSDTTLRTDLLVKARLYARAGIAEYWVVDLNTRQVHVHRRPVDGNYGDITVIPEAGRLTTLATPASSIAVIDVLPPKTPS